MMLRFIVLSGRSCRAPTPLPVMTSLLLSLSLSSCQGFEAVQPQNYEQILSVSNVDRVKRSGTHREVQPMPLPSLKASDVGIKQVPPSTGAQINQKGSALVVGVPLQPFAAASPVPDITIPPYSAGGRSDYVFAGDPTTAWYCTAQLIGDEGVVLTAAHCVYDRKTSSWINSMTFRRQFAGGSHAGSYDWQCAAVFSGWTAGSYPYDFAFVKLRAAAPPKGLDLLINVGAQTTVEAIGYSKKDDPNNMWHAIGPKDGGNPTSMESTLSGGSSGGAWIVRGNAISLNSFTIDGDATHMHGPQFTGATLALYDFVRRGCVDNTAVAGRSASQLIQVSKKNNVQVTPAIMDVTGGAIVQRIDRSKACPDSAGEFLLRNASDRLRLIGVRVVRYVRGATEPSITYDYHEMEPSTVKSLGCMSTEKLPQNVNSTIGEATVFYDHAGKTRSAGLPKATSGVPFDIALLWGDIEDCIPKCTTVTTDACIALGTSYIPVMAPLAKFLTSTQAASGQGDGLLIKKTDIVAEYGGEMATPDPCVRSDINKVGMTATNDGLACIVRATNPINDGTGFAVRLLMTARTIATPSAWDASLSMFSAGIPVVYFRDRAAGARLEFEGTNASSDNAKYGGDVNGIAIKDAKQLIVSTSNGCVRGRYVR